VSLLQGASQFKDFCLPGCNALSLCEWFLVFLTHLDPSTTADPHPMSKCHHSPADLIFSKLLSEPDVCSTSASAEPSSSSDPVFSATAQWPNCSLVLPNQSSALQFNKKVKTCHCHLKTRSVQYTDTSCLSHTHETAVNRVTITMVTVISSN